MLGAKLLRHLEETHGRAVGGLSGEQQVEALIQRQTAGRAVGGLSGEGGSCSSRGGSTSRRKGRSSSLSSRGGGLRGDSADSGMTEVDALLAELDKQFSLGVACAGAAPATVAIPPAGPAPPSQRPAPKAKPPTQPHQCGGPPRDGHDRPPELALADGLRRPTPHVLLGPRKPNPSTPLPPLAPQAPVHAAAVGAASEATAALDAIWDLDDEAALQRLRDEVEAERQQFIADRVGHAGVRTSPPPWSTVRDLLLPAAASPIARSAHCSEDSGDRVPSAAELREHIQEERRSFLGSRGQV